jgi:Fe-S cluster biogenesis protein NfuA
MIKKIIKTSVVPKTIAEKIEKALDKIRPMLIMDGGNIEFVSWDEKKKEVRVRMTGHCAHCPMSQITLKEGVAKEIVKAVPEVEDVISV